MPNIIAITTFSNPDLLWIYLENLCKGPIFKYGVRLFTEEGYNAEINDVIDHFSFLDISLKVRKRVECPLTGFHNILETYRDAAEETDEYVIVGEDDLILREDALEYHENVYINFLQKYDRIFCVGNKRRPENELNGDPNILIGDYQMTSPTCVSKKAIEKYLLPHLVPALYKNPSLYYYKNFPNSRIPYYEALHHDVFIERVMWDNKLFGLKPDQAISGHLGLRGINSKGLAPQGNLQDRVNQYKELMKDGPRLRSLSTTPEDLVVAPDWVGGKWNKLELDIDRTKAKASSWWYDTTNELLNYITNEQKL